MKKDNEKLEKKNNRKKLIKKIILVILFLFLIFIGVFLGISAHNWEILVREMFNNENSIVVDIEGKTIAELRSRAK